MTKNKISCPDCGPNPTPHYLTWFSILLDRLLEPYIKIMDSLWRHLRPWLIKLPWDKAVWRVMRFFHWLGLGELVKEIRPEHSLRLRALWEEATRRGIELFEFRPAGRSVELMVAKYNGYLFTFNSLPRPRQTNSRSPELMDDKVVMREKFKAAAIPIARGGMAVLAQKALQIFDEVKPPVIVKPRFGSRSRHTFIHVSTRSQLVQAFYSAQKISPWVLIEEELRGAVHRATVINNEVSGVVRRDLPQVIGDGMSMVSELVAAANKRLPLLSDVFAALPTDDTAEQELRRQGLNWNSIPDQDQIVTLGQKVNRGLGGITTEVTPEVHADNIALFKNIAQVVDDPIIGIDFIINSISWPWHKQTACGVIECNSLPFIDLHHYPFYGSPRNAAGAVWNLIWSETAH